MQNSSTTTKLAAEAAYKLNSDFLSGSCSVNSNYKSHATNILDTSNWCSEYEREYTMCMGKKDGIWLVQVTLTDKYGFSHVCRGDTEIWSYEKPNVEWVKRCYD